MYSVILKMWFDFSLAIFVLQFDSLLPSAQPSFTLILTLLEKNSFSVAKENIFSPCPYNHTTVFGGLSYLMYCCSWSISHLSHKNSLQPVIVGCKLQLKTVPEIEMSGRRYCMLCFFLHALKKGFMMVLSHDLDNETDCPWQEHHK